MSSKKSVKSKAPKKSKKGRTTAPKNSTTWEEHGERVRVAIGAGMSMFMKANEERIAKASSAEAAKNSYVSGMIDMLTVARNALGFWGADQILMELERLNGKRSNGDGDGGQADQVRPPDFMAQGVARKAPGPGAVGGKGAKGTLRDPMFA